MRICDVSCVIVLWISICFNYSCGKSISKRNVIIGIPTPGEKLACDRGQMSIQCNEGSSIYVTSAVYGRTETTSICSRGGTAPAMQSCSSPDSYNKARAKCYGKRKCTIQVNEEFFGNAVTSAGIRCTETPKYLKLEYECIPDCKRPRFGGGVSILGTEFALGSTVTVQCGKGFAAASGGEPIREIKCEINGSWTGGLISCQDINECEDDKLNDCNWHADCTNVLGSYSCACGNGYFGDGFSCNAADEDRSWIDPLRTPLATEHRTDQSYSIETDSNCGGKLFETSGNLNSPNYPSLYPNSANCEWVLSVPPSKIIEIEFLDFQLEQEVQDEGCSRDFVAIYDGPYRRSSGWLATYCGSVTPPKVKSTLNQMRLEFKTDPEATFSGFRAIYRSFDPKAVCKNFGGKDYAGVVIIEGTTNASAVAGQSVVLGCKEGYKMVENAVATRVCQNDNTWNDITNPCSAIRCNRPKEFEEQGIMLNGTAEDYRFMGRPLMYSCRAGFMLVTTPGMKTIIFCNSRGRWSNEGDEDSPECRPISCEITLEMTPPQHTYWKVYDEYGSPSKAETGRRVSYSAVVEYSCAKGYSMVGEARRTCSGVNNRWSGGRVFCEEDNGVPGLTNLQIAVITACVSIVIIIVIGASLLYCCISEKRSRELRLKTVGRVGHSSGNNKYYRPKFQYTGDRNSMSAWSAASKNFDQTRNSSLENHASLNLHEHYAKRPYMLPSVVQQPRNAWTSTLQTPFVSPYEQSNTAASNFSSNFYAYNAARPSNRSKNGYAKYQKRFKK